MFTPKPFGKSVAPGFGFHALTQVFGARSAEVASERNRDSRTKSGRNFIGLRVGVERPEAHAFAAFLKGDRRVVIQRRRNFLESPARGLCGIETIAEQCCGAVRPERDVELIERERQAFATGLYVSLLAGPAIEERRQPRLGRDGIKLSDFSLREEAFGNLVAGKIGAHEFDIDANLSSHSNSNQRQLMRMRQIKAQVE